MMCYEVFESQNDRMLSFEAKQVMKQKLIKLSQIIYDSKNQVKY